MKQEYTFVKLEVVQIIRKICVRKCGAFPSVFFM